MPKVFDRIEKGESANTLNGDLKKIMDDNLQKAALDSQGPETAGAETAQGGAQGAQQQEQEEQEEQEEPGEKEYEAPRTDYYTMKNVRWDAISLSTRLALYKRHGNPGHEGAVVASQQLPPIAPASPRPTTAQQGLHYSHADSHYVGMEPSLKRPTPWEMRAPVRRMTDAVLDQAAPPSGFAELAEVQFAEQYIRAEISQMDREAWEREQRRKVRGDEASVHWTASPASICHVCTRRAFHSCLGSD